MASAAGAFRRWPASGGGAGAAEELVGLGRAAGGGCHGGCSFDGGGMAVNLIGGVQLAGGGQLVGDWMGVGVRAVGSGCRRYGQRAYLQILLS